MNEAFIYILLAFFGCLQQNIEPRAITDHQTSEENKATASDESQALRSEPKLQLRRQVDNNKQDHNKYFSSQQFGSEKSKSAVVERDVGTKHQAPNLELSDLDGTQAPLEDNVASDLLSRYDKQGATDSDTNKYQGFAGVNLKSLESNVDEENLHPSFDNPKSISTSLQHDLARQIKLTKYPTVRKKRDSYISSDNPLFSDKFQRLPQPENRLGVLSVSVDPRIKKAVSPEFDSSERRQNSANYHTTADKQEGSSLNSWKPIHGNKLKADSFKPEHGMSSSTNLKKHDPVKKLEQSEGITDSKRNNEAFSFGVATKKKDVSENGNIMAKDEEYSSNNLLHRSSDISQSPVNPKPQGVVKNTISSNDHDQQEQIPDKSCNNQMPHNIAQTKDETVSTGTISLGEDTSKHQVMRNIKDISADTVQLSPSKKELDPNFEKKNYKREIQSKSDSEEESKKLIKKDISTAASHASNLATPSKNTEKLEDEPLQISLDQDVDNMQTLQKRNADPTLIHKRKAAAATSLNEVKRSMKLPGTDNVQENDIKNKVFKRNIQKESIMREIIPKNNQLKNNLNEKKPLADSDKVSEQSNLEEDDKELNAPGKVSESRSLKNYKSLENTENSKRQSGITEKTEGKLALTDESSGNEEKFDAKKLSKLIGTENKNSLQNVGDTYIEAEDPNKSEVRRETEERDEERELEDTIAGNDEMEKGIEIGSQKQEPKFIDYSNTHVSQSSNPEGTMHHDQHEQQNHLVYEGTSLVSADELEPDGNRNMDDDDDVNYDDLENDYSRGKRQGILKSDDSDAQGEQTLYQEKEDGVQTMSQVSAPADIPDDTRIHKRDSDSKHSGNKDETEDDKRTENQIQSRIDALKDNIKREIVKEEIRRRKENGEVKSKLEEPAQHTSTLAEQEVEQSSLLDPSINVEELLLPHSSIRKRREAEFSQSPTNEMAEVESNIPHSRSKRTIITSPDPGAAYDRYRAEDDEDDDEGGEFDDDGFDSRTSNLISRKREVQPVATYIDQDSEKDFNSDQNARVPSNNNVADDISNFLFSNNDPTTNARRKRDLQNFRHSHQVSAFHGGGGMAHHSHLMKAKTANNNNQDGQSKASGDTRIERSINVEESNQLQNPSANNINLLPQDLSSFSGTNELSQPEGGGEFDDVFGGLSQSSYNGELSRVKRVKREPRKQNPEKFQTETISDPEVYGK